MSSALSQKHRLKANIVPVPGAAKTESMLGALWHETLNLAIRAAAAASLLNRCDRTRNAASAAAMGAAERLTEGGTPILGAATSGLIETRLPERTAQLMRQLYATLTVGRGGLARLSRGTGAERQALVHDTSQTWRDICGLALALIYDLELAAGTAEPSSSFEAAPELLKVLREARRGGSPCLDGEGRPYIPAWAQKRADLRRPFAMAVQLESGGEVRPAEIRDVSEGGLGLSGVPGLSSGSAVTLILDDGERLAAQVAWAAKSEAGLQLVTRLPADHRLLRLARGR